MATALARPDELRRLGDAIVGECLGMRAGELLLVDCEPAHRELATALARACLRAGVDVDIRYADWLIERARLSGADDAYVGLVHPWQQRRYRALTDHGTSLTIAGDEMPDRNDDVAADRLQRDMAGRARALGWLTRAALSGRIRWSATIWPTPAWAAKVYPELRPERAARALLDDLLWFCRLGPDDADGALPAHLDALAVRARTLTARGLRRLELRASGTALDIALPDGAAFIGGRTTGPDGRITTPNLPTEEVFTSPDAGGTEGTFRCTRPLAFAGRTFEGISGEFRRGRLTRLDAATEEDRAFLAGVLASQPRADRLGEVALIDATGRIGTRGRTYFHPLLEENQAAHIAFGSGFAEARIGAASPASRRTVNRSDVHLDVMVGSPELEVTAVDAGGERVAIVRDGTFQL